MNVDASSFVTSLDETSLTTTDTDSTTHTNPGPGALSGKAILALGKATLRGAEALIIRRKLHAISSRFPHWNDDYIKGIEKLYADLLELSRQGLYPSSIRDRALSVILTQIRRQHVEKLVHCLARWSSVELQLFIWELMQIFSPLQLFENIKDIEDKKPSTSAQTYRTSVVVHQGRVLEPFMFFLHSLVCVSEKTTRTIFDAGVMEFLIHIRSLGFAPIRSRLRLACDSLLDACLETKGGWNIFLTDRYHVLWPLHARPPSPQHVSWSACLAQRAEAWRSMKPEIVKMRMMTLSKMIVKDQLENESLDDIAADILEFWRLGDHDGTFRTQIIDVILVLAGKRTADKIIYCLSIWPPLEIQALIPRLTGMFDPYQSITPQGTHKLQMVNQISQNSVGGKNNCSREAIIIFLDRLAQTSAPCAQVVLESGILEYLLQLYFSSFSDPLAVGMYQGILTLREACDSLLFTLSKTEQSLKYLRQHQLYILWPTTPTLPFTNTVLGRQVARAEIWRSINPEFILRRLASILTIIRAKPIYRLDLPEFHPLGDIAYDCLEVLKYNQYSDATKSDALALIIVLIGSRRIEELVHGFKNWPPTQKESIISTVAEAFVTSWLFKYTKGRIELSNLVQAYQGSLANWENHSFEPLVTFFRELTEIYYMPVPGTVVSLLTCLYLSDFFDPLRLSADDPTKGRADLHDQCDVLLLVFSKTRRDQSAKSLNDLFEALWSLQLPCLPRLRLQVRLSERARVWGQMEPAFVKFRVQTIFDTTPVIWGKKADEQETLVRTSIIADLVEFLGGTLHMEPTWKFRALSCLYMLLSYEGSSSTTQVLLEDLIRKNAKYFSRLIPHILRYLLKVKTTETDKSNLLCSHEHKEYIAELCFESSGVSEMIDFFMEVYSR